MDTDPWLTTTYASDANGAASVYLELDDFSLGGTNPVAGRTIVVHDSSGNRIGCGVLESTAGEVVSLTSYPDYSGSYKDVVGTFLVTQLDESIKIEGTLGSTEPDATAGIHIHSGFTCDKTVDNTGASMVGTSVGGHFYDGMDSDPWTTTYTANSNGVATIDLEMSDFSVSSSLGLPVAYRTFVVHDSSSARIGCGIVGNPTTAVATLTAYPDYSGGLSVDGTIAVTEMLRPSGGIYVFGTLTGLEASVTGAGIHIHSGVSCATTDGPAGHFYPQMDVDPWLTTTYDSNGDGVATVAFDVAQFTLTDGWPVAGRTVVVHDSSGTRIACGVLESTAGEVSSIGTYPGSSTGYSVLGTALVQPSAKGIEIKGTVGGLESSTSGGFHIHSGYSVDVTEDNDGVSTVGTSVGGHFWEFGNDPWNNIQYASDAGGSADISMNLENFTMDEAAAVAYHPLVVHLNDGTRAGAGLIATQVAQPAAGTPTSMPTLTSMPTPEPTAEPTYSPTPVLSRDDMASTVATISGYPEYSGDYASSITGTLVVENKETGIHVYGTLAGVEASATGAGIHIHSGVSCDSTSKSRHIPLVLSCLWLV